MTVLQGNEVRGFAGSGRKLAIQAALVLVGLGVAFGISRVANDTTTTYAGPMVDRSLAMEDFFVGETYAGPLVDRSLAMEDFYVRETYAGPLVARSLAMEEFYKSRTYEGSLVKRSLAMEDFYNGQDHFRRQNPR